MSHFTVLVIGDDIEEKLAPYDEHIKVPLYKRKCWCVGLIAQDLILKDLCKKYNIESPSEIAKDKHKEFWKSYDTILEQHSLKDSPNESCDECNGTGLSETTYNPQSKWDWYEIGGRWMGMLPLKKNRIGIKGRPGIFDSNPYYENGVDQAKFGDIDWDFLKNDFVRKQKLSEEWDKIMSGKDFYNPDYYLKRYGSKEEYIRKVMSFTTYAVVTEDGKWHSPGNMGWFGMSDETIENRKKWEDTFWSIFMNGLSPDTLLTIVDCHI